MSTYKDLLQYLGISHPVFMIILIGLFLVFSFVMLLSKLGFLSRIKFKHGHFPKCRIVYTKFQAKYDIINSKVHQVMQESKAYFKLSDTFAIYYDPADMNNPSLMEAVIGRIVKDIEWDKAQQFVKKSNGKYRKAELPQTRCICTRYPYFNSATLLMIVNRVYPKLAKYVHTKRLDVGPGVIEIYHILSTNPFVLIMAPLENKQSFILQ